MIFEENNASDETGCNNKVQSDDDDDGSDGQLKIIEESPKSKRSSRSLEISADEAELLADMGRDLEWNLEEKAAKSNLKNCHVKRILKHVITNEQFLAYVRQSEYPEENISLEYEPKLTRAKAKELYPQSSNWVSPNTSKLSETQVLISEDLPEDDSSGDEYIPVEEESEDDRRSAARSRKRKMKAKTLWSEDGVFKLPESQKQKDEKLNIALRTRSKLCLSDTPLEVIEEAFIPPDIPLDMLCDLECDDDVWKDFLKEFTRPLDEVTKGHEDEDHDPEYNILADEEIDKKVDKEELRADRAVKVTRKELNKLISELFDYSDNFTDGLGQVNTDTVNEEEPTDDQQKIHTNNEEIEIIVLDSNFLVMEDNQKELLAQQMRQHVQALTTNFLLTYSHPELDQWSTKCYENLVNLQDLSEGNGLSYYNSINLQPAMELIEEWKQKLMSDDLEAQDHKRHVSQVMCKSRESIVTNKFYIPTFSSLLLDWISKSYVFIYPSLLPRISFKSWPPQRKELYTHSEHELAALGLEQFVPFLKMDPKNVMKDGSVRLKNVCQYICEYLMPVKQPYRLLYVIKTCKDAATTNPIKYYFENNCAPVTSHYVIPMDLFLVIPPCERERDVLPEQWKNAIYPPQKSTVIRSIAPKPTTLTVIESLNPVYPEATVVTLTPLPLYTITKVVKPPVFNRSLAKKRKLPPKPGSKKRTYRNVRTHAPVANCNGNLDTHFLNTPKPIQISDNVLKIKFNSSTFKTMTKEGEDFMPSMPSLSTPVKNLPDVASSIELEANTSVVKAEVVDEVDDKCPNLDEKCPNLDEKCPNVDDAAQKKDNLDDINALMVASSTIKSITKKKLTGAEKKKAKIRREFNSNLRMLSEETDEAVSEKTDRFVQAFFDKVKEQLEIDEYHKIMELLTNFDKQTDETAPSELFKSVEEIIGTKHPDILDEFLCFFTSLQAKNMGRWMPYLIINKMSQFLRSLELFFKDQPSQVKKIYRCLTDLTMIKDVTMPVVKNTILPLLKGNSLLVDLFLQMFLKEKPPDRLFNGPWENLELGRDSMMNSEECYESIVIPECEDSYGGPNCICSCHSVDDSIFKTRNMHCTPCGKKYMQGKLYVQTGKGLRIGKITFEDNSIDHLARLSCPIKTKRTDSSPSKQISPGKESQDETKLSSDDEPDKKHPRLAKPPKKRKPRKKIEAAVVENTITSTKPIVDAIPQTEKTEIVAKKDCSDHNNENTDQNNENTDQNNENTDQNNENTSDSSINEIKQAAEENIEWDCNTSIESIELKLSPEPASAESESEFCEETSQDNNTDSDVSGGESETNSPDASCQWSRDEDKIILEVFRKVEDKELAFRDIVQTLEHKTLPQIQQRFDFLISLLEKMSKGK